MKSFGSEMAQKLPKTRKILLSKLELGN